MKNNKGFIGIGLIIAIVVGVLVIGGGAYYIGTKNDSVPENVNMEENNYQPQENQNGVENNSIQNNQSVSNNDSEVPTLTPIPTPKPDIKKETKLLYNNAEYSFVGSQCSIQGEMNGSVTTWYFLIDLLNTTSFPQKDIIFTTYDNGNTINNYLQKGIDIATKGVKISNRLTNNTYSTKVLDDISVVWENLSQNGNNFSGNGYINLIKDIKPNEGVCNGTETVNQKYLTSSDPEYSMFCPSPVFPTQKIYFNCSNGIIHTTPAVPLCAPGSVGC